MEDTKIPSTPEMAANIQNPLEKGTATKPNEQIVAPMACTITGLTEGKSASRPIGTLYAGSYLNLMQFNHFLLFSARQFALGSVCKWWLLWLWSKTFQGKEF